MSDIAPSSNPIDFRALSSWEVDGALVAGAWLTHRSYDSVRVEPLEDPNVAGAWIGLYRVIARGETRSAGRDNTDAPGRTVILVCSKDALVIGDTRAPVDG